jgi:hypothetical protein
MPEAQHQTEAREQRVRERDARSSRIRELLEHDEIGAAFDEVKQRFIAQWEQTRDPAFRENMWMAVNILTLVRTHLASLAVGEPNGALREIERAK